ncbi:hypothetical protein U0070_010029, partial [Myodes glareolus]
MDSDPSNRFPWHGHAALGAVVLPDTQTREATGAGSRTVATVFSPKGCVESRGCLAGQLVHEAMRGISQDRGCLKILSCLLRGSEPLTGEKKMKRSSSSNSHLAEQGGGVEADKAWKLRSTRELARFQKRRAFCCDLSLGTESKTAVMANGSIWKVSARVCNWPRWFERKKLLNGSRDMCLRAAKKTSRHPLQEFLRLLAERRLGGTEALQNHVEPGNRLRMESSCGAQSLCRCQQPESGFHGRQQQFTLEPAGNHLTSPPYANTGRCPVDEFMSFMEEQFHE